MRRRALAPTAREFRSRLAARLRAEAGLARLVLPDVGGEELLEAAERAAGEGESVAAFLERLGPRGPYLPRVIGRVFGPQRAARIEAGEAVPVASWELPSEHPAHSGAGWYTLEPDGSLTELE
jgi:hypothetical protein